MGCFIKANDAISKFHFIKFKPIKNLRFILILDIKHFRSYSGYNLNEKKIK